jgi:hypothetical protein
VRSARAAVFVLALLGIESASAQEQAQAPSWYAEALAHSEGGLNVTHFWSKGPKLRAETVIAGHRVVTIVSGQYYYAYDALTREGVAIRRAPEAIARDAPDRRPFGRELEILIEQGAEKVREDTLHGRSCDVYRVTDRRGKRELWVTQGAGPLPVRLEIYSRSRHRTRYTDYSNWMTGIPVPDAFFEPETGVKLDRYEFEDYLRTSVHEGPVGPVPVLYADLLHGGRESRPPQ